MPQNNIRAIYLIVLLMIGAASGCGRLAKPDFAPERPALRIVTYNINWGGPDPMGVAEYLKTAGADVIFLQETHQEWEKFLKSQLGQSYPYSVFEGGRGGGGIALMAKYPLQKVRVLEATAGWFPALLAEVVTEIGRVQVLNVHLKPPLSETGASAAAYYQAPEVHRAELTGFLEATRADMPLIIAGDFNENETKKGIQELTKKGFTDCLSLFDRGSKTWSWKIVPGVTLMNRFDHILINRHLDCTGAKVAKIRASDHRPVMSVLVNKAVPAKPAEKSMRSSAEDIMRN